MQILDLKTISAHSFIQGAQLCESFPSGLWKKGASKNCREGTHHSMEEEEELEAKRGDDEGGHLDDQEHGGRPYNLGEAGSECAILRWENLSNQGVRHSTHSKAIGYAGKE